MTMYQTSEEGSVPGLRNRARGAVTLYSVSSLGRGTSRALNFTEKKDVFKKITSKAEDAIEAVWEKHSKLYLKELRKLLKGFNFGRHDIRISAGMGSTNLYVHTNGSNKRTAVYDLRSRGRVIDQLQEIDQLLDGSWDWSSFLDGQSLTRY